MNNFLSGFSWSDIYGYQSMIPFAIVGSEKSVIIDGKTVRGRKTRWGVINIEDERHCDFVQLRNFLTR